MGGEQTDRTARGRILAAAERLFAERGFDHTPTALIAAEARVPQGLIFYHFKTKMDLPDHGEQEIHLDLLPLQDQDGSPARRDPGGPGHPPGRPPPAPGAG